MKTWEVKNDNEVDGDLETVEFNLSMQIWKLPQ